MKELSTGKITSVDLQEGDGIDNIFYYRVVSSSWTLEHIKSIISQKTKLFQSLL